MKTAQTCCTGDCLQGRACPLGTMPTRRVLGLHQQDGGETVDYPPVTAAGVTQAAWWVGGAIFAVAFWTFVWMLLRAFSR